MEKSAFIYFMTNKVNTVLYIGVTADLLRRVAEHKAEVNHGFTCVYKCNKLVYYESGDSIGDAIQREKQLKGWNRAWKDALVADFNPLWKDLSKDIGVTTELIAQVAADAKALQ